MGRPTFPLDVFPRVSPAYHRGDWPRNLLRYAILLAEGTYGKLAILAGYCCTQLIRMPDSEVLLHESHDFERVSLFTRIR